MPRHGAKCERKENRMNRIKENRMNRIDERTDRKRPANEGLVRLANEGTAKSRLDCRPYPSWITSTSALPPSYCGADKALSLMGAFSLLVDTAAVHCERIGTGCADMAEAHRFWLMTRARIVFHRRPSMMEEITVTTWPEAPRHFLCNRNYTVEGNGGLLLEGYHEWAVLDTDTLQPIRTEEIYPAAFSPLPRTGPSPFSRLRDTLGEDTLSYTYKVAASDIDFGNHVNNTRYIRMLTDSFSVREFSELSLREAEIQYLSSATEGEVLGIFKERTEDGYRFAIRHEDGRTAALARFVA